MTLRLVGKEAPKPLKRPRARHEGTVLTPDEQRRAKAALRGLRDAYGTWTCLAAAMDVPTHSLHRAVRDRVSAAMLLRASKTSGRTVEELLGGPVPADRCRACGQIKRAS